MGNETENNEKLTGGFQIQKHLRHALKNQVMCNLNTLEAFCLSSGKSHIQKIKSAVFFGVSCGSAQAVGKWVEET